jgi:hypothetical protein
MRRRLMSLFSGLHVPGAVPCTPGTKSGYDAIRLSVPYKGQTDGIRAPVAHNPAIGLLLHAHSPLLRVKEVKMQSR